MNDPIIYQTLSELPDKALTIQLESVGNTSWRTLIYQVEDGHPSVINILEHDDHVALIQSTTQTLNNDERVWVTYKGGWFVEVRLSSKYDRTNARYLRAALMQSYMTPEFKPLASETQKSNSPEWRPTIEEAYELMRNPSARPLAVRLRCHQLILAHHQPINKAQYLAEAVADLCQSAQLLLRDHNLGDD